jgi:drug/metabolite transporter (DMT)-like permease
MPLGIEWFWLLMTGVTTQFGQFFMTRAYQSDKASNVSAISYAGIIWGAGFGVFLFDEKYQWLQYAGMALVLLGMFLNVRINLRREAAQ